MLAGVRRVVFRKAGGTEWHSDNVNRVLAAGSVFDLDDNSLIFAQKHELFRIEGTRLSAAPSDMKAGEVAQDSNKPSVVIMVGGDGYFYQFDGQIYFYGRSMAFVPNETAVYHRFPESQEFTTQSAKQTFEANGSHACALQLLTKEFERLQQIQLNHDLLSPEDVDRLLMLIEQVTVLRNIMISRGEQQGIANRQLSSMFGLSPSRISQIVQEGKSRLDLTQVLKRYNEGGQQ